MDKKKIFAILLIAIATSSVLLLGATKELGKTVTDEIDLGSNAQCSVLVDFYGYFEGERVTVPVVAAPWAVEGIVIEDLAVNMSWTASGEYMDWSTLAIIGSLKIYLEQYGGGEPLDITSNMGTPLVISRGGEASRISSTEFNLPLSVLLAGETPTIAGPDEEYWDVVLEVVLNAEVTDNYGDTWKDGTGTLTASIRIYNAATGFDFSGGFT